MSARHALNARPNRAYRFAEKNHVQSIMFSVSFGAVCTHGAGLKIWRGLSAAAKKVLVFYAALNRSGKAGFRGTACHLVVIAEQVERATGQGCSLSTLKRGLKNLEENGLIIRHPFALYDAQGAPVIKEIRPHEFVTVQLVIVALTDLALSLWSKNPGKRVKMSPRQSLDTSQKPSVLSKVTTLTRAPVDKTVSGTVEPAKAGTPTRLPGSPLGTVEHGHVEKPAAAGKNRLDGGLRFSSGVSCLPPSRPAARERRTPETARIRVLRALWYQLRPYPNRIADIAFQRALDETSREWGGHLPRAVNWGWVFNRWGDLDRLARSKLMKGEIIPALRATTPLPAEPVPTIEIQYTDEEKFRQEENAFKRRQQSKLNGICETVIVELDHFQPPPGAMPAPATPQRHVETKKEVRSRLKKYILDLKTEKDPTKRQLFKRAIEALLKKVKTDD